MMRVIALAVFALWMAVPAAAQDSTTVTGSWTLSREGVEPGSVIRAWLLITPPRAPATEGEPPRMRVVVYAPAATVLRPAGESGCEDAFDGEPGAATLDTTIDAATLDLCLQVLEAGGGRLVAHVQPPDRPLAVIASPTFEVVEPPDSLRGIWLALIPLAIGSAFTLLLFVLQQLWPRFMKWLERRKERRAEIRAVKLEVAEELLRNARELGEFLGEEDVEPPTLWNNGANHVLRQGGLTSEVREAFGDRYLKHLQDYYEAVREYDTIRKRWETTDVNDTDAMERVLTELRTAAKEVLDATGRVERADPEGTSYRPPEVSSHRT